MTDLNQRLLQAHAQDNRAELVTLYSEAAETADDTDAACFYMTYAYIYGLELDHPLVPTLYAKLKDHGRV